MRRDRQGRRHGNHSVVDIAVFIFIAWHARLWTMEVDNFGSIHPGAGILSVLLFAFAAKALKIIPDRVRKSLWSVGLTVGAFITFFAPQEEN